MRFVCDAMLAKLGRWLRMIGHDTVIADPGLDDREVLELARQQGRVLLTRDKRFLKNPLAYYVRSRELEEQLADVVGHFRLDVGFPDRTLCPACGGILRRVPRPGGVPEGVRSEEFWQCADCEKTYWRGGHWKRIESLLAKLRK